MKFALTGLAVVALGASLGGCTINVQPVGYTGEVVKAYGNETGPRRFVKPENRIGCAAAISVRNVNQTPTYDMQYEAQFGSPSGAADIAAMGVQLGLVNVAAAAIGMMATTAVEPQLRGTEKEIKLLRVPTGMKMVKAVQLRLEDGSEVNLPLLDAPKLSTLPQYKAGSRYVVFYSPTFDNIQVLKGNLKDKYDTEQEEQRQTQMWCKRTLPNDKAAEVLKAHANKVDEAKIY